MAPDPPLDDDRVRRLVEAESPEWELAGGKLARTVVCPDFRGALGFVTAVGDLAEAANHHPDIDIRYNRVVLSLVSHDAGGITQRDIDLAKQIDGIVPSSGNG